MKSLYVKLLGKLRKEPFYCGFTTVTLTKNKKGIKIHVNHGGNMGNSIERSVNPNLKLLEFPSIEQLKKTGNRFSETGWPDYNYDFVIIISV